MYCSSPDYTPEPDIIHEIIGHVPIFLDSEFADLSQAIGLASLGADNEEVTKIAAIYWYTFEFGAVLEQGKIKPFSAGIAGSVQECIHFQSDKVKYIPLDPFSKAFTTQYVIQDVQDIYYYCQGIQSTIDILKKYLDQLSNKKPCKLTYNKLT